MGSTGTLSLYQGRHLTQQSTPCKRSLKHNLREGDFDSGHVRSTQEGMKPGSVTHPVQTSTASSETLFHQSSEEAVLLCV